MGRGRKTILIVASALLICTLGFCGYNAWAEWHYKYYGGFETAGIEPIPGAELISYNYESGGFLPDYDARWVYRMIVRPCTINPGSS